MLLASTIYLSAMYAHLGCRIRHLNPPHLLRSYDMQRVPKIITLLDNPPSGVQGFTRGMAPFHPAVPALVLLAVAGTVECSRSAADSAIRRAARNDAENTIPVCERKSLSRAAPRRAVSVSASRPAPRAPRRFVLAFSTSDRGKSRGTMFA